MPDPQQAMPELGLVRGRAYCVPNSAGLGIAVTLRETRDHAIQQDARDDLNLNRIVGMHPAERAGRDQRGDVLIADLDARQGLRARLQRGEGLV